MSLNFEKRGAGVSSKEKDFIHSRGHNFYPIVTKLDIPYFKWLEHIPSKNEGGQSNSKPFFMKNQPFSSRSTKETATCVGRKCEDGPGQAECSELDAACS